MFSDRRNQETPATSLTSRFLPRILSVKCIARVGALAEKNGAFLTGESIQMDSASSTGLTSLRDGSTPSGEALDEFVDDDANQDDHAYNCGFQLVINPQHADRIHQQTH